MRLRHVVQLQGHGRPEIEQARAEARALRNRGRGADWSMGVGGTFHARVPPLFSVTWAVVYRCSYSEKPREWIARNINGLLSMVHDFWLQCWCGVRFRAVVVENGC